MQPDHGIAALGGGSRTAELPPLVWMLSMCVGVLFATGLIAGIEFLNGTWYWRRPWQDLGVVRCAVLLAVPMLPLALALQRRQPLGIRWRLAWLVLAAFGLQLAAALCHPHPWERLQAIIESPVATSYFTDAVAITELGPWLAAFHEAELALHSATHPPGPILFHFAFWKLFGTAAPLAAALAIGVIASLGVPLAWWFAGRWSRDAQARLRVAALYAIMPALVVFFPEFDQLYPLLTMLIVAAWLSALEGSRVHALWVGVALFVATFFAWNLLALGVFVLLAAAWRAWAGSRDSKPVVVPIAGAAMVALVAALGLYALLWLLSGYRPVASLQHALATQSVFAELVHRPWLACVLLDPWDFLVGTGIAVAILPVAYFRQVRSDPAARQGALALAGIGLASVLLIDLSGLLRTETARVWLFLQPFMLVPAGLALARFTPRQQALLIGVHWWVLVIMVARLSFIDP
ncbi:MAG: hypothetical protein J0H15_10965 [Xanthomonadales bacterium]|nr:hypothetical protein [Xanthomonadales bacterium]